MINWSSSQIIKKLHRKWRTMKGKKGRIKVTSVSLGDLRGTPRVVVEELIVHRGSGLRVTPPNDLESR